MPVVYIHFWLTSSSSFDMDPIPWLLGWRVYATAPVSWVGVLCEGARDRYKVAKLNAALSGLLHLPSPVPCCPDR